MTAPRKGTLFTAVGTAALAGFLFGFDTAVIAGATADLSRVYNLTPSWLGFTVSAALWGTLIGALFAGKPGDKFGSRDSLKFLAFLYFITGLAARWRGVGSRSLPFVSCAVLPLAAHRCSRPYISPNWPRPNDAGFWWAHSSLT